MDDAPREAALLDPPAVTGPGPVVAERRPAADRLPRPGSPGLPRRREQADPAEPPAVPPSSAGLATPPVPATAAREPATPTPAAPPDQAGEHAAPPATPAPGDLAGTSLAGRAEGAGDASADGLSARDAAVLRFEQRTWRYRAAKDEAIRAELGMSPARYYQVLNALIESPAALAADPVLVGRLARLRTARRQGWSPAATPPTAAHAAGQGRGHLSGPDAAARRPVPTGVPEPEART
jgi:hypothetical protein